MILKRTILISIYTFILANQSYAADAKALMVKVYGVWASQNQDCTGLVRLFDHPDGEFVDFLKSPEIGGGVLPDGTYNCVVIKMSDNIKFTPSSATTNCSVQEYTADVCRLNSGTAEAPDGTSITCRGTTSNPVEDQVYLYLSTGSSGTGGNAFIRPKTIPTTSIGLNLGSALVIQGPAKSKFVVDGRGKVDTSNSNYCDMNAPTFSFQQIN